MTFDAADIRARILLGEDSRWEFKELVFRGDRLVGPKPDALADELAAFANGRGGVLLLGVTDSGEVQEVTRAQLDALETTVVDLCRNKIKPQIQADIRRFLIEPGKPVLSVEVEPGYAQHDSPGGAYRRIGSSKQRMSSDERLRLAQSRSQARFLWFDKQPVPGTGFRTLDEALWKPMLDADGRRDPRTRPRETRLAHFRSRRGGGGYRRRSAAVQPRARAVAAECLHHRHALSRRGPWFAAVGRAGHHRSVGQAGRRSDGVRPAKHAGGSPQVAGPDGSARVQRRCRVRGRGERGRAPGLRDPGQPVSVSRCSRTDWNSMFPGACRTT